MTGITFYLYFLVTQREFAYRDWKEQTTQRLQVALLDKLSFAAASFDILCSTTPAVYLTLVTLCCWFLQADGYAKRHLDISRYQKLKKDIERYKRYLHSDSLADNVKLKNA